MKSFLVSVTLALTGIILLSTQQPYAATAAITTYASDAFARSVTGGWGTADVGGNYTLQGNAASFAVKGSVGTINATTVNRIFAAYLKSVSARDVDLSFRTQTDKLASGGNMYAYVVARLQPGGDNYLVRVLFGTDGRIYLAAFKEVGGVATQLGSQVVVSGLTHKANTFVRVRAQVVGANPTTLRMRAWANGTTEPTSWQYSVTDATASLQAAGAVGLRTALSSSVTNAPVQFSFDDFQVTDAGTLLDTPVPVNVLSPTLTPKPSVTNTPTRTLTRTPTAVPSHTATRTLTPKPTATWTPILTTVATQLPTLQATATRTSTSRPTATSTPLLLSTPKPTATATNSASVYWGTLINGVPDDMPLLTTFENNAGKKVSLVHWSMPWKDSTGQYIPFQTALFERVRQHGSINVFTWGSHQAGGGTFQADFQNRDISSGTYDSYILQWAMDAKAWGYPIFLRFDHEMDGWWYAWGEGKNMDGTIVNGNSPGDYVTMWRHVHDIFTSVGATNVTWVWCPSILSTSTRYPTFASIYPGDAYVDWTCLDGYNKFADWYSVRQIFTGYNVSWMKNSYQEVLNVAPNKPMMIGETASLEAGDDGTKKGEWFRSGLLTDLPTYLPKVKAFVYFNWDDDNPTYTYPIETTTKSIQGFAAGIGSSYYATNTFGSLRTSPIPPLR